ncbi:hypothetical protein VNO77_45922 [Canavalia gladiata]|uniref:Uncharacterized protein n=1 Tax=Canavalia gladiata TaxID=3824 RepID=A0AAN9JHE0_CANGL
MPTNFRGTHQKSAKVGQFLMLDDRSINHPKPWVMDATHAWEGLCERGGEVPWQPRTNHCGRGWGEVLGAWCLVLGAWCLVLGAWCLVLGAWCLVLGAWCLVLGAWCLVLGAWCLVLGAWCLVLGAWCLVLGAWCLVLGAWCLVLGAWCLVLGAWCLVLGAWCLVLGAWCLVLGAWCLVLGGAWCLVLGAWCLVLGAWCLVLGAWCLVLGAWCLVLGAWCLVLEGRIEATRAESQWIVAARPLCHLQYPVAYLSRLQRILPIIRWELHFKASCKANTPCRVHLRHVPLGGKDPLLLVGKRTIGARIASSPDSDLEAFSHNPTHGSFAPLAFQPSAMTNCANQRFLSY